MKAKLMDLFGYNTFYNQQLIQAVTAHFDQLPQRVEEILNHILNSHLFWNRRILGETDIDRWQMHPLSELAALDTRSHQLTAWILDHRALEESISFQNSKGSISEASIETIYFHLINHGTYHRGQLALLFRQANVAPLQTDYIFYKIHHAQ
ncbi:MAG TPA: DinB family protein [Moheibacter sp.]|nr:DinB family protein [Moheibacter sp.]